MEVEDGIAFCPNCASPQIRVTGLVGRPLTPPPFSPESIAESSQASSFSAETYSAPPTTQIRWPEALRSAGLAGMLLAVALVVPFASPFLLMMAAGVVTVALYAKRSQVQLTRGSGARVGAAGGLLGWAILLLIFLFELGIGGGHVVSALRETIQQQMANNPDPRAQQVLATLNSPGGMAVMVVLGMLLFLVVALLCGAIGGAIGALLVRRSQNKDRSPQ